MTPTLPFTEGLANPPTLRPALRLVFRSKLVTVSGPLLVTVTVYGLKWLPAAWGKYSTPGTTLVLPSSTVTDRSAIVGIHSLPLAEDAKRPARQRPASSMRGGHRARRRQATRIVPLKPSGSRRPAILILSGQHHISHYTSHITKQADRRAPTRHSRCLSSGVLVQTPVTANRRRPMQRGAILLN